jgi:hypothetical protein
MLEIVIDWRNLGKTDFENLAGENEKVKVWMELLFNLNPLIPLKREE